MFYLKPSCSALCSHLINVWVPVLVMLSFGRRAVDSGEKRGLSEVHQGRVQTKGFSNHLLDSPTYGSDRHITNTNTRVLGWDGFDCLQTDYFEQKKNAIVIFNYGFSFTCKAGNPALWKHPLSRPQSTCTNTHRHTGTRTHTVNQGHMKDRQRHHFKWFNTNSWKKTFKLSFSKVLPK